MASREELLGELRRHQRDYPSLVHGPLCGQAADEIERQVNAAHRKERHDTVLQKHIECCGAPAQNAWQPIATAPKDGTRLLGYWAPFQSGAAEATDTVCWCDGNWCDPDDTEAKYGPPTQWMPLPAPPSSLPSTERRMCHDHPTKRCSPDDCCQSVPSTGLPAPAPHAGRNAEAFELANRLEHAVTTMQNDDLSPPQTEKRARHVARCDVMLDVIKALRAPAPHEEVREATYDMRALAKFLYEHCGLSPDKAGKTASEILSEYDVRPLALPQSTERGDAA